MKNLTITQARSRRRWMIALFVLDILLLALTPPYVMMTVGGGYRDLILQPELAGLTLFVALLLWPFGLVVDPLCFAAAAALVLCGVVIAVELWRRKRYLEETYQLRKSE